MGGYMTDNGDVNWERTQILMSHIGEVEDDIFRNRAEKEARIQAAKNRRSQQNENQSYTEYGKQTETFALGGYVDNLNNVRSYSDQDNKDAARSLKRKFLSENQDDDQDQHAENHASAPATTNDEQDEPDKKRIKLSETRRAATQEELEAFKSSLSEKMKQSQKVDQTLHPDNVQLGSEGWRERYYQEKFHTPYDPNSEDVKHVALSYAQGLLWVFRYYYRGCISWGWYYPYHYAPFASDLVNLSLLPLDTFEMGTPFKPYDQLMGVLPPASAHALPLPYRDLMCSQES
ncbi:exoribonuclease, partial [Acrasis kona]